jgi:hypothetical protein
MAEDSVRSQSWRGRQSASRRARINALRRLTAVEHLELAVEVLESGRDLCRTKSQIQISFRRRV